ncbi:UNKNOWN [Stylonychia lemnae]|uniref:RING-type domain-containing protein n=1 Tax=Stylonychia lemnae TaxID=5949 RepID=A0A078BD57_STYLE|nr:UNKNOWN [Stylonychia lemnae]|eukprot:CDW91147.1 UNKNOWN [Stylonychia lemnae]
MQSQSSNNLAYSNVQNKTILNQIQSSKSLNKLPSNKEVSPLPIKQQTLPSATNGNNNGNRTPSNQQQANNKQSLTNAPTDFGSIIQQSNVITHVNVDTEKKLRKLQELAQNDKEMIELQRKTVYIQKLEIQSLQQKYEALKRNFEAISTQSMNERQSNDQAMKRIQDLEKDKERLNLQLKDLQNKFNMLQIGPEFDNKKDMEIKELKDMNEMKKEEIYSLKKEVIQKQKKIAEVEVRFDQLFREKDKEVEQGKSDLVASQDLIKEQNHELKTKDKNIQSLEQQVSQLNRILDEKTEANLTMSEVIKRVKNELTSEYEPMIKQAKEESNAKDLFWQREIDKKMQKQDEEKFLVSQQVRRLELQIEDWKNKLEDKQKECQNYLQKLDEKRDLYNELMQRKEEMELNKNNIIDDLEKISFVKDQEIQECKNEISILHKSLLDKQRELESEKQSYKEKILILEKQNEILSDMLMKREGEIKNLQNVKNSSSKMQSQEDLERKNVMLREELGEKNNQIRQLQLNLQIAKGDIQNNMKVIEELQNKIQNELENQSYLNNMQLKDLRRNYVNDMSSLKKILDKIEIHISCLSCAKVYQDCLMLVCGHCICHDCISKHSDPKSKDSIVFCEECKIETKNRYLVKSLSFKNINANFITGKQMIETMINNA